MSAAAADGRCPDDTERVLNAYPPDPANLGEPEDAKEKALDLLRGDAGLMFCQGTSVSRSRVLCEVIGYVEC